MLATLIQGCSVHSRDSTVHEIKVNQGLAGYWRRHGDVYFIEVLACPGSQQGIEGCWGTEACAQLMEQDESGIEANQWAVISIFGDEEPFDIQSLYSISDNYRLCLSENFMLTGGSLSVSQSASQAIDFNSCLIRAESI
ncbi:MAG: hypothetical protein ACPHQ9_16015 [Marinobacter sp.]|uniref:hypothetical protein n=1 Tax=Marinobacter sp. TaxID=50741 RepID=UPI003C38E0BB